MQLFSFSKFPLNSHRNTLSIMLQPDQFEHTYVNVLLYVFHSYATISTGTRAHQTQIQKQSRIDDGELKFI